MLGDTYIYHISKDVDVIDSRYPEAMMLHDAAIDVEDNIERDRRIEATRAKRKYSLLSRIASIFI